MKEIDFFNIEQLKTEPTAKLTWSKIEDCSYYIISRKILNDENSDYVQITKTKKEVYYDRKLEFNKNYSYKLRAVFDVDFFELKYEKNIIIKNDFKTFNFFNSGLKYSNIEKEFPFNEMKLVDSNKEIVSDYKNAKFLKIPKFYILNDYENKKFFISKTMINPEYDLFYSFIIDDEIIDYLYISLESIEQNKFEKKENRFIFDISSLNLIQFLYWIYFNTLDKKALIFDITKDNEVLNKPFNSDGLNNYFLGLKNIFSEEIYIDGIIYKNNLIYMSINPLENNKEGFGYEEYDDFNIKNGLITEYDIDFFMPLEIKKSKEINLDVNGKYLVLNKSLFNYQFKNEIENNKIRYCEF